MTKSRRNVLGSLWGALFVVSAVLVGCGSEANNEPSAATTDPGPVATTTSEDAIVVEVDDQTSAQAAKLPDGHYFVRIARKDGTPQMEANFAQPADGKIAVEYTFHPPVTGDDPTPSPETAKFDMDLGEGEAPTLQDAVNGTVFLHTQMTHGTTNEYDSWGCDLLPGRFNGIVSCGPKGRCCDVHDACYKRYNCTSGSWKSRPWSKCQVFCNIPAVACFTNPIPAGPSACCFKGNCGRPR